MSATLLAGVGATTTVAQQSGASAQVSGAGPTTQASQSDGRRFPVSQFVVQYKAAEPPKPSLDGVGDVVVTLGKVDDGYVNPRPDVRSVTGKLSELAGPNAHFYTSALEAVCVQVVKLVNQRGLIGIYVEPDPEQVTVDGDRRAANDKTVRLLVYAPMVKQVRTVASGERVAISERVDNPVHRRISEQSPALPGGLLQRNQIEDYVLRLNRHPGRRVDVAVAASEGPDEVFLDYLIAENRPWLAYVQVSNTGTEQTNEWRERFGFVHNQLTGRDDVLTVDYTTAGFEESHAVGIAYEAPFFSAERVRWRGYGTWNQFTASDVGQTLSDVEFNGQEWTGGGELIWNFLQSGNFFMDAFAGAQYEWVKVRGAAGTGRADFVMPYAGLRMEKSSDTYSTDGEVKLTYAYGDEPQQDLDRLGRLNAEDEWFVLSWELSHSFYLEPVFAPAAFKEGRSTLAHEVYLGVRGQYSFDNRLIPQAEETLGGFFSVRGYDESLLASDNAVIATAEYRFHIPRSFTPQDKPGQVFGKDFRWVPQRRYSRPDWDLILRAFLDVGHATFSDPNAEDDETLVGTGLGIELQIKQNFNIRMDWGVALERVGEGTEDEVEPGDDRFHISATLLF